MSNAKTPSSELTGGICPVSGCGQPATADLAPNPGPVIGGSHAPPFPPPEGVTMPEPEVMHAGPWYLVLCADPAHRTLVAESDLEALDFTVPPPAGTRKLPPMSKTKPAGAAASHPSHATHSLGHAEKK